MAFQCKMARCATVLFLLASSACVTERVQPEERPLPAGPAGQAQPAGGVIIEQKPAVSPGAISAVIAGRQDRIRACYETRVRPGSRRPRGKVVTFFKVAPSGAVIDASVIRSTLRRPDVEECLIGELQGLQFPPPEGGGSYEIEYPFLFKPAE